MKINKTLILVVSIAALLLALLGGSAAVIASTNPNDGPSTMEDGGGSQQWFLFKVNPLADFSYDPAAMHDYMMQRAVVPGAPGSLASVDPTFALGSHMTYTFFADESANGNVTFAPGEWDLYLSCVSAPSTNWGKQIAAQVGYYDGSNFIPFGPLSYHKSSKTYMDMEFVYDGISYTVPDGNTLVVQIYNGNAYDVQIVQSTGTSLSSPESDPGYPLPEIAAGILLGGGLIGLVGYVAFRRNKVAAVN
jgi:hypothetical protein